MTNRIGRDVYNLWRGNTRDRWDESSQEWQLRWDRLSLRFGGHIDVNQQVAELGGFLDSFPADERDLSADVKARNAGITLDQIVQEAEKYLREKTVEMLQDTGWLREMAKNGKFLRQMFPFLVAEAAQDEPDVFHS